MKNVSAEVFEEVANFTLSKIKASANNYDETDFILRDHLCSLYLGWNQFSDAAATLAGLNLDSTTRPYTDFEKANTYVKCAEAYLADDSAIDAEVFVNKARTPMETITEWTLQLRYKVVLARILDANRKFTEAAKQYYELSTMTHADVSIRLTLNLILLMYFDSWCKMICLSCTLRPSLATSWARLVHNEHVTLACCTKILAWSRFL